MSNELHVNHFPCPKCPQHYATRTDQVRHLETEHAVKQPWLCYHCSATFEMKDTHAQHQKTNHAREMGYHRCPKRCEGITSKNMLARHLHYDHTPRHACFCGFQNASHIGISVHMLHEHAIRCKFCGATFITDSELFMHSNVTDLLGGCPAKAKRRHEITPPQTPGSSPAVQSHTQLPPEHQMAHLSLPSPATEPKASPSAHEAPGSPEMSPSNNSAIPEDLWRVIWSSGDIKHCNWTFKPSDFDPTTVYGHTLVTKNNYRECPPINIIPDEVLFHADPKMLAYGNLLRLAQHYSNVVIFQKANAGRPTPVFNSVQALERRLVSAYNWAAEWNSPPKKRSVPEVLPAEVKQWVKEERSRNGVSNPNARKRAAAELETFMAASSRMAVSGTESLQTPKRVKVEPSPFGASPSSPVDSVYEGGRSERDGLGR